MATVRTARAVTPKAANMARVKTGRSHDLALRMNTMRVARDMSQADFAKQLGLSRGAITQWEQGITTPSLPLIEKSASILGTTPEYLAFGVSDSKDTGAVSIPFVSFSADGAIKLSSTYISLDGEFAARLGINDYRTLKAFAIGDDPGVLGIKKGDRVIFDTAQKKIETKSSLAILVHGQPRVAVATLIPSSSSHPKANLKLSGTETETQTSNINVLGHIVAVIHRHG